MPRKPDPNKPKRPRTPAQQMNDERLRAEWAEKKAQGLPVHASDRPPERTAVMEQPAQTDADDAGEDLLAKLGQALLTAGKSRAARNQTISELEGLLSKLSPRDYPELADNPVIMSFLDALADRKAESNPDDPPGTIYNAGTLAATKKRWQWRDLDRRGPDGEFIMPRVTFTPMETIPITYNGLQLVLIADQEMTVPKCFKDIYDERRKGLETARQHAAFLFRQRDNIDPNRADPSVLGPSSALVRGHGMGNTGYKPGAGAFNPGEDTEGGEES